MNQLIEENPQNIYSLSSASEGEKMKEKAKFELPIINFKDGKFSVNESPEFNNKGKMIFNCIDWPRDNVSEKIHPTQKPVELLKTLIKIFTDEGDVVIDPCAGSGSTLIAAQELKRKAFGFEIKKPFFKGADNWIDQEFQKLNDIEEFGFAKTLINKTNQTLF